jgi:hypothetical protein
MDAYVKVNMVFDEGTQLYELHIEGVVVRNVGVTQCGRKDQAEYMVKDYLFTVFNGQLDIKAVDVIDKSGDT